MSLPRLALYVVSAFDHCFLVFLFLADHIFYSSYVSRRSFASLRYKKYSQSEYRKVRVHMNVVPRSTGNTKSGTENRPLSKMAAENLNKSKLKTNTITRKSILTLVTLPSFSISGEISAEKM